MSKHASPAMIGAFVVTAFGLVIAALLVLGGGRFSRNTVRVITYFEGSVNGLRIGSSVKFRGIEIGSVKDIRINMSGAIRDPHNIRIPVVLEIDKDRLSSQGVSEFNLADDKQMQQLVELGLRAELGIESILTNLRFVAIDIKPDTPARLVNDPAVDYPEIPSLPSFEQQIPDKVIKVLTNLADADVAGVLSAVQDAANDAHTLLSSPHLARTLAGLDDVTETLRRTVADLSRAARDLGPVAAEWKQTATSARRLVAPEGPLSSELDATLRDLRGAARSIRRVSDQLSRDPGSIVRGGGQ
ncbi:MAG: Mammalian cell entry related domain protein [Myxococcales bacterium]|nr:Mammalian cell entry related domain protein [Myxococcales bacterium]